MGRSNDRAIEWAETMPYEVRLSRRFVVADDGGC